MPDGWDASLGVGKPARGVGGAGSRRALFAGLWCLLGSLLAGPLIGLAWAAVSPELELAAVLDGSAAALDVQITIDAYFGLLCAGFGVLVGLLAFFRFADAGWPVPSGIAAGGFGGSIVAGWLGHRLRSADVLDRLPPDVNQVIVDLVDFRLRSHGLYLVFPVVALVVLAVAVWAASVRGGFPYEDTNEGTNGGTDEGTNGTVEQPPGTSQN